MDDKVAYVVDYFLEMIESDNPVEPEVVLALCELKWPDRGWTIDPSEDKYGEDDGMCTTCGIRDRNTNETATEVMGAEFKVEAVRRHIHDNVPVKNLAKESGASERMIRDWIKELGDQVKQAH